MAARSYIRSCCGTGLTHSMASPAASPVSSSSSPLVAAVTTPRVVSLYQLFGDFVALAYKQPMQYADVTRYNFSPVDMTNKEELTVAEFIDSVRLPTKNRPISFSFGSRYINRGDGHDHAMAESVVSLDRMVALLSRWLAYATKLRFEKLALQDLCTMMRQVMVVSVVDKKGNDKSKLLTNGWIIDSAVELGFHDALDAVTERVCPLQLHSLRFPPLSYDKVMGLAPATPVELGPLIGTKRGREELLEDSAARTRARTSDDSESPQPPSSLSSDEQEEESDEE